MAVTLVEKYNPEWPKWFEEIKTFLGKRVSQACIRIEHVGSTSIPAMTAKPIIDLILVVKPQGFEEVKTHLSERGYYHQGDKGIQGREAFDLIVISVKSSLPCHHLYVCSEHSTELKKQIAFRDFMRQHAEWRQRLNELKLQLCKEYDNDRQSYIDGKAAMVSQITELALKKTDK